MSYFRKSTELVTFVGKEVDDRKYDRTLPSATSNFFLMVQNRQAYSNIWVGSFKLNCSHVVCGHLNTATVERFQKVSLFLEYQMCTVIQCLGLIFNKCYLLRSFSPTYNIFVVWDIIILEFLHRECIKRSFTRQFWKMSICANQPHPPLGTTRGYFMSESLCYKSITTL